MHNQRHRFFVDRAFQAKYGFYVGLTLLVVCGVSLVGLYFGIWSSVIEAFSDEQIIETLATASRMQDYEAARSPLVKSSPFPASLRLFREVDLLGERQREILNEILMKSNLQLAWQGALLVILIAIGSIYLTHRIAGPMLRLKQVLKSMKHGNLTARIRFRKNDELKPVAEELNQAIERMNDSINRLKELAQEAEPARIKKSLETELGKFRTTHHPRP